MTAPRVDYKIHWLKMMSVPESRAVVGRHDGINGRDTDALDDLSERALTPAVMLGDSHYGSSDNMALTREQNINLVAPARPPKCAVSGRLTLEDFTLNQEGLVLRCPNNVEPVSASLAKAKLQARFDLSICQKCPDILRCPVQAAKRDGQFSRFQYTPARAACPSHLFHPSQKPWNIASPPDTLSGMHKIIEIFADRAALHTEILALRQQVAVLKRKRPRPLLRKADRVFWVILSCLWPGWRHALVIVRPETVIGWHRKGFRLFWTWKSRRGKPGCVRR